MEKEKEIRQKINKILHERDYFDISVSIMGLRSLLNATNTAKLRVSFTNHVAI